MEDTTATLEAITASGVPHRVVRTQPPAAPRKARDWPKLRALLGVSRMSLPDADEAQRVTGYPCYTITPFGSTRAAVADVSLAET